MANPTGLLFADPRVKPLSTTGAPQGGCYYCFFGTGTTTLANVYADGLLTTPLSQPTPGSVNPTGGTVAASDGRLAPIYLDPSVTYRAQLYSAAGVLLEDTDPYVVPSPGSGANASTLSGIASTNFARVTRTATEITAGTRVVNQYQGVTNAAPYVTVTELATTVVDFSAGDSQQLTLTGNRTVGAPTNALDGEKVDLLVVQDATGGRTLTWDAAFLFPNGSAPALAGAANGADRFQIIYNASLGKFLVTPTSSLGNAVTSSSLTISQSGVYFNLLAALGGTVSGTPTITVTVSAGVILQSLNPALPAMDLTGLPSGSTLNLVNNGYIIGCGGDGARGAQGSYPGSGATVDHAENAGDGGPAIYGPGAGVTFNITNGSGYIWGGGGGGGGGGAYDGVSSTGAASAGGGGGGAGGGRGGKGATAVYISGASAAASDGSSGTLGPNGTAGAAGAGVTYGAGVIGASAAGGAYGAPGSNGAASGTVTTGHTGNASNGGAAGYAISLHSGPAPTFASGGTSPNVKGSVA